MAAKTEENELNALWNITNNITGIITFQLISLYTLAPLPAGCVDVLPFSLDIM